MSLRREPAPAVLLARGALLALTLTPLAVDSGVLFPFVSPKALALRAGVAVAATALLVGVARSEAVRAEIGARFSLLWRQPLALANAALLAAFLISVALGVQPARAFFGDAERGEGWVASAALAGYFLLTALVFDRETWTRWLWLVIGVGGVLFAHAFWQWSAGVARPGSFTGQAAFLGPYALFVIGAAVIAAARATSRGWRAVALAVIPLAIATILLTETRAAMLGAIVGGTVALVLVGFHGARRLAVTLTVAGVLAVSLFISTREATVWQSVPGVARVATWSGQDASTQTRLAVWEAGLAALSPRESGWHRVAFGWGLESFHVPFNRHYAPTRFAYDDAFYDRSHNKLLDVALMTGLVGLLAYLAVWGAFFATTLRVTEPIHIQGALLFVGTAYFVQNLVSFDSLTTYVPLFGLWAFAATLPASAAAATERSDLARAPSSAPSPVLLRVAVGLIGALALVTAATLVLQTLPAYRQMRGYVALLSHPKTPTALLADWERVREPHTYAQSAIRADLVPRARVFLRQDLASAPILAAAITAMDETVRRDTLDPRLLLSLAEALGEYADAGGDASLHATALQHLQRARALAPGRAHLWSAIALAEVRLACTGHTMICYYEWLAECVTARDLRGTTLVRERLELLDPPRRALLADLDRLVRRGEWDAVRVAVTGTNVTITLTPSEP